MKVGYSLSDNNISPSDILSIKGRTAVQEFLTKELQAVSRLQGVKINDKHIEVLVRQMLSKVEVVEARDSIFLTRQTINKFAFREENDGLLDKKIVTDSVDFHLLKIKA